MGVEVLNVLASGQRRGAETFAHELHRALVERGVQSAAVCLVPGAADSRLPLPALGARPYSPGVLQQLRRAAKESLVVIGHGSSTLLACGLAMVGLRVPFVYVNIGDPRHWATTRGRRLRVGLLLRRASAVAAISAQSRELLMAQYGVLAERIWVIPNGRSGRAHRPSSAAERVAARARLGLPPDGPMLASIGALSREKRVDAAVQAMADLPEATLVVVGEGPERATVETLAASAAPGRVRLLGTLPSVVDILAAADVLVLSSESEGVPGILIEAGMSGVPAVTTDVGFVRDVVIPGQTGEVVPPGRPREIAAAVEHVLIDRERYAANARAHCLAHFEIGAVVDQWEELLDAVIMAAAQGHRGGAGQPN